ncbi:MAG: hypothetical protein ACRDQZ_19470 [Mycobacteriales bacterium]
MTVILRCNRCGEEDDDPDFDEHGKPAPPPIWQTLSDGVLLCGDCWKLFRDFLAGKEVPCRPSSNTC